MHRNFLYMLLCIGSTMRLPDHWGPTQRKLYWLVAWVPRAACLLACIVRVAYAKGPAFTEYLVGTAMIVVHVQFLIAP